MLVSARGTEHHVWLASDAAAGPRTRVFWLIFIMWEPRAVQVGG